MIAFLNCCIVMLLLFVLVLIRHSILSSVVIGILFVCYGVLVLISFVFIRVCVYRVMLLIYIYIAYNYKRERTKTKHLNISPHLSNIMVQNYYALKREASQIIKDTMQYLEANPDRYVPLVKLTIEFQQRFGFGERI